MTHSENENAVSTELTTEYGSTAVSVNQPTVGENQDLVVAENVDTHSTTEQDYTVHGYQRLDEANSIATRIHVDSYHFITIRRQNPRRMETEQLPVSNRVMLFERLELGLNILAQLFIATTATYMSWFCLSRGLAGTALHAWLVTLGFACLMAEGIMVHYNANVLTGIYKRNQKTRIHWILQAIGGSLGMLGALIKCVQKGFLLHTIHGKLGFIAMILCFLTMISGVSALYAVRVKNLWSPLQNKGFHNFLGLSTFIIAMFAQYYGYRTAYYSYQVSYELRKTMEYVTLIGIIICCVGPIKALIHKVKSLNRQFN